MKKIALRIHSSPGSEFLSTERNPEWKELIKSERPPIGSMQITESIDPAVIDGTEYPPVDCDIWLETREFEVCKTFLFGGVERVECAVELALRRKDLLEQSRSSGLSSRYLRDIDIAATRKFPVISIALQNV